MMAFRFRTIVEDYEAKLLPVNPAFSGINAHGKAEWERFGNGGEEFDVRVRNINLIDGSILSVHLNQQVVGQITLKNKHGRLRVESRNGSYVPAVTAGNKITIKLDGAEILEGIFVED